MHSARKRWYQLTVVLVILFCASLTSLPSALASHAAPARYASGGCNGQGPLAVEIDGCATDAIQEPAPHGTDDQGNSYSDNNFSQNCGPGASTVALSFWRDFVLQGLNPYQMTPGGEITFWGDTDFHSYIMYLATEVNLPASAAGPAQYGEIRFNGATSLGTDSEDLANVLNEVAGESFYVRQLIGPSDAGLVHQDIVSDLTNTSDTNTFGRGIPPIVEVQAQDLPDWHGGRTNHFVAIVGYDDSTSQYSYIETCGTACGGTPGLHQISQARLFQAILDTTEGPLGDDRALIW